MPSSNRWKPSSRTATATATPFPASSGCAPPSCPDIIDAKLPEAETARRWKLLDDAELAQQLYHYPPDYVGDASNKQRVIEP